MLNKPKVARSDWHAARESLLKAEKAVTRERDAIAKARQELPMLPFPNSFFFDAGESKIQLAELFDGRSQLVIYHFLLPPGADPDHPAWRTGVDGCAFVADHFDAANVHLRAHDLNIVCVAEAPFGEFAALRERMGWKVSCFGGATKEFHGEVFSPSGRPMDHTPGISVFLRNDDQIYLTYTAVARGVDILIGTYNFLDMAPLGRNEISPMDWMRFHDEY
ncbi:MAG: DUF899 domain-containing protein [Alphaproteobacteria bacterium]|nr:DUF899 domain-containing protein [Alphaproteobacteria bacterium]MBU1561719.1 DUF899 domain-containing protein [Alphaproteobacteria bacterium]MBU2303007.1 DUF899 domain-containing protein [Alphaproteobacteria bacterium]MBU2368793.1 DUF899 domain-containing protein [Alphaproteobacteria bacterium]